MRTSWLPRVHRCWLPLIGVFGLLLLHGLWQPLRVTAAPTVALTSTFQWLEPLGDSTLVHLGGEVTNTDLNHPAGLVEVHYLLYAGAALIGPDTVHVWEMGADILAPGQTTPFQDIFAAPAGYTNAVVQSVTATDPLTPPDHAFTVTLHDCPDVVDAWHVCGTVTNNNVTTVDNVRVVLTFFFTDGGGHTTTVDEDVAPLMNNATDSLEQGKSADFELVRSPYAPSWNGAPAAFAESTTTVPGVPGDVSAIFGNHSATVSWTPPVDGGRAISGYTVTATPGGQTVQAAGGATSATVNGLANGTSYTFTVTAANAVGSGNPSAASNPVVPATVPDKPTAVSAALLSTDVHTARVTWTAPFDEGRTITSYLVTASPGGLTATVTGAPPQASATVSGLVINTTYTFTVTATNILGTSASSDASNPVTPLLLPPTAPTNVIATPGLGFASVTWSAASSDPAFPVTRYTVKASPGGATAIVDGTQTSAVVAGLASGQYTFSVTAANGTGPGPASSPSVAVAVTAAGQYHPIPPVRILDTRNGIGGFPIAPLGPAKTIDVGILGNPILLAAGVPAHGVSAVVMNVTVTQGTAPSYLAVFPTGSIRRLPPTTSNLNFSAGQDVPNLVVATLGSGGFVTAYNNAGTVHVIFDVQGWISTPDTITDTAGQLRPVVPVRLLDTRDHSFGVPTLGTQTTINLTVAGIPSVPANASAVVLNVTATNPTFPGFVTVFPTGTTRPDPASNLNFVPGLTVPNRVIVKVGAGGKISLFNLQGNVDLIVDLNGWFTDSSDQTATGGEFSGVNPYRILDTRTTQTALGQGGTDTLMVAGTGLPGGVPAMTSSTPPSAVVLNVTATNTTVAGHLRVYPSDASRPNTSDLNWIAAHTTVPNLVIVKLSHDGSITLYNCCGSTDVVIDVLGWYSAPAS